MPVRGSHGWFLIYSTTPSITKKVTFISQYPPYGGWLLRKVLCKVKSMNVRYALPML